MPFVKKFDFMDRYIPEPNSGCWLWLGPINYKGYGKVNIGNGIETGVHRASWERHFGKVPHGKYVCHKCDVRSCINPNHLFIGTPAENSADMVNKGRSNKFDKPGQTHPSAKLSEAQALEIYTRFLAGEKRVFLAAEYKISIPAVYSLCAGRTWKNATRKQRHD